MEVAPLPREPEVECPRCGRRLPREEVEGHVARVHAGTPPVATKGYGYPRWMGPDPDAWVKERREGESKLRELQAEREWERVA